MAIALPFTARTLTDLPLASPRTEYRDAGGKASRSDLYLYAGQTGKTFYWHAKINGKKIRYKIGPFPDISIDQARRRCVELSADKHKGIDPREERKRKRARGITLGQAFEVYIEYGQSKPKPTQQSTVTNYRRSFANHLSKWKNKPVNELTYTDVQSWYNKAAAISPSSANTAMAAGKAVVNHLRALSRQQQLDHFALNPFEGHKLVRLAPRTDAIESSELTAWFEAVDTLSHRVTSDYLKFLLFTGLRRREASTLKWRDVDLTKKIITARGTKNGTDHTIPLSTVALQIIERRHKARTSDYVFNSPLRDNTPLAESKHAVTSIFRRSGVKCSPHGLRRTYSNMATHEASIPYAAIKRLLNHSTNANDVTEHHYTTFTMEQLRRYQQAVCDALLNTARATRPAADVLTFPTAI